MDPPADWSTALHDNADHVSRFVATRPGWTNSDLIWRPFQSVVVWAGGGSPVWLLAGGGWVEAGVDGVEDGGAVGGESVDEGGVAVDEAA